MNRATTCFNNNDGNGELWTSDESSNSHRFLFCFEEKRIKRIDSIVQKCLCKTRTCMLKEHITRVQFGPLKRGFPFKRPGVFLKSSWVYCHVTWARFTSRSGTEGRWIHRLETDWREHWTGGGVGHKLVQCTLEKWWPLSFVTPRLQLEVSWQQVHQGIMAVTLMQGWHLMKMGLKDIFTEYWPTRFWGT